MSLSWRNRSKSRSKSTRSIMRRSKSRSSVESRSKSRGKSTRRVKSRSKSKSSGGCR